MNTVETLDTSPFKKLVLTIGALPTAFLESMTYYEALAWLVNYIENTIVPAINSDAEAIQELQEAYTTLKNYVDNYFENLDVQEEINNKLDEMAESGELTDIIAQYLQLAGVLAYDTISDMAGAENLANGSICRVLGNSNYASGDGAFYRVRTLINTDVVDGVNLVAITTAPTLVAERITDGNLNSAISTLNTNITNGDNFLKSCKNTISNLVIISDSYGVGNSYPSDITSYAEYMKTSLGLTTDTFYNKSWGGAGFEHISYDKKFLTLINECNIELSNDRKNAVTHVLIAGGYNDQYHDSEDSLIANIIETTNRTHEVFPNAEIYVAFIGWCKNNSDMQSTCTCYINGCGLSKYGKFITNSNNILTSDMISGDGIHPNEDGYKHLAKNLVNGLQTGSCYPQTKYTFLKDNADNTLGVTQCNNDALTIELYNTEFTNSGTANGGEVAYKTLADTSMIYGRGNFRTVQPCIFVNNTTNRYVCGFCGIKFDAGTIKLYPHAINNAGDNFFDYTSIRFADYYINVPHKNS